MKLRNKKTGEIVFVKQNIADDNFKVYKIDGSVYKYAYKEITFEELKRDYEQENRNKYWFIRHNGFIDKASNTYINIQACQEIGNLFETDEQARTAVEKLKAWKRLKDKGFKFLWWLSTSSGDQVDFYIPSDDFDEEAKLDLDLLFGGKE